MSVRTSVSRVQVSMEKFGRRSMACAFSCSKDKSDQLGLLLITFDCYIRVISPLPALVYNAMTYHLVNNFYLMWHVS